MARGKNSTSKALTNALSDAQSNLWQKWKKATRWQHSGERGDIREAGVSEVLTELLPSAFSVATGEAVDMYDHRTTQLDVVIFDGSKNFPLAREELKVVLPAEALLSSVEVKSILSAKELVTCFRAAMSIRALRPYKGHFVSARSEGKAADDGNYRCFYTVLAFSSNLTEQLSPRDWLKSEWGRISAAAQEVGAPLDAIDRIVVMDRGVINPVGRVGKIFENKGEGGLLEWYIQLANFLARESARREPLDLQSYMQRRSPGWIDLP